MRVDVRLDLVVRVQSYWEFSIYEFEPEGPVKFLPQNLRQHVRQDAAGAVVVFFHGGVDADDDGDVEAFAVGGMDAECGLLHGLEVVVDAEEYSSEKMLSAHE